MTLAVGASGGGAATAAMLVTAGNTGGAGVVFIAFMAVVRTRVGVVAVTTVAAVAAVVVTVVDVLDNVLLLGLLDDVGSKVVTALALTDDHGSRRLADDDGLRLWCGLVVLDFLAVDLDVGAVVVVNVFADPALQDDFGAVLAALYLSLHAHLRVSLGIVVGMTLPSVAVPVSAGFVTIVAVIIIVGNHALLDYSALAIRDAVPVPVLRLSVPAIDVGGALAGGRSWAVGVETVISAGTNNKLAAGGTTVEAAV